MRGISLCSDVVIEMRKYTLKDIVDLMEFTPKNGVKLLQVIDDESDESDGEWFERHYPNADWW